jgi:PAS domain-containing protein
LLLETLATLAVTLGLSWLAMNYALAVYCGDRAADVERHPSAAYGSVPYLSDYRNDGVADVAANPLVPVTPKTSVMLNAPWLPFLMILLPANVMTMVMYAFRAERKHISESEERFRNAMEYSAIGMALVGIDGQWLQANKALCNFLGYTQDELRLMTFQQLTWPEDLNKDLEQLDLLVRGKLTPTRWKSAITPEAAIWSGRCWQCRWCAMRTARRVILSPRSKILTI